MPISSRWRPLRTLPPRRGRDAMPGVYELADETKLTIYIGQSARDVPNRIRQHLSAATCVADKVMYWRYAPSRVPQAEEAKLIAIHLERHGELPLCNRDTPTLRDASRRYAERSR